MVTLLMLTNYTTYMHYIIWIYCVSFDQIVADETTIFFVLNSKVSERSKLASLPLWKDVQLLPDQKMGIHYVK